MRLIGNWNNAYKMFSVQAMAIIGIIAGAEPYLPQLAEFLPSNWVAYAMPIVIVARLIKQNSVSR